MLDVLRQLREGITSEELIQNAIKGDTCATPLFGKAYVDDADETNSAFFTAFYNLKFLLNHQIHLLSFPPHLPS